MLAPMGYIATTQALVGVPHDAHDSPTSVLDPAFGGETSIPIVYRPSKSLVWSYEETIVIRSPFSPLTINLAVDILLQAHEDYGFLLRILR